MPLLSIEAEKFNSRGFSFRQQLRRHLNKLRWTVLTVVFSMLIVLPMLHLYQTYLESNTYEVLSPNEKLIFNAMKVLTVPLTSNPESELDNFKGSTWTGTIFGVQLSDPLAVVTNFLTSFSWNAAFLVTALIPVLLTILFGRFFCGWICPATFIYELNDNIGTWLHRLGLPIAIRRFDLRLKYLVLLLCLLLTIPLGAALISSIYPPAVIGRELYFAIAKSGFGFGMLFIFITIVFDLFVSRRGFCRYLCPGGALYSLLGRYRLFRIKRDVTNCNDCAKCNTVCQFGLDPMHDNFGQECNNCTACVAICPTDTLVFVRSMRDLSYQGPGHLGNQYKIQLEE